MSRSITTTKNIVKSIREQRYKGKKAKLTIFT